MKVTLLQPNPRTGDYAANLEALRALCERVGVEEDDLVVLPLGSLEGGTGASGLRWPDQKAAFMRALARLPDVLPARRLLLFYQAGESVERVFFEDGVQCVFSSERAFVVDGIGIALHPGNPGDILIEADRLSKAEARAELPRQASRLTLSAGIAGGQDRSIFAGDTGYVSKTERVLLPLWSEGALRVEVLPEADVKLLSRVDAGIRPVCDDWRYEALRAALRDYVAKSGVNGIVLGLSGGIDSALSATLARDAIGADRVRVIRLPSRFTSGLSNDSAEDLARRQGLRLDTLPIEKGFAAFEETLAPLFEGTKTDVTEENLQARVRGTLLMAVANKFNLLLLCNANKAESAMGYSTLYGDQTGGFAPLSDLWKSDVTALCRARNRSETEPDVIPVEIIEREPSAELRDNQKDSDSLPPYPEIERVLRHVLKGGALLDLDNIDPAVARRILRMTMRAAFKREQSVPGAVITDEPLSLIAVWGMNTGAEF